MVELAKALLEYGLPGLAFALAGGALVLVYFSIRNQREITKWLQTKEDAETKADQRIAAERIQMVDLVKSSLNQYGELVQTLKTSYEELMKELKQSNDDLMTEFKSMIREMAESAQRADNRALAHMTKVTADREKVLTAIATNLDTLPQRTERVLHESFRQIPDQVNDKLQPQFDTIKGIIERRSNEIIQRINPEAEKIRQSFRDDLGKMEAEILKCLENCNEKEKPDGME